VTDRSMDSDVLVLSDMTIELRQGTVVGWAGSP
jgi:hypothetical protein